MGKALQNLPGLRIAEASAKTYGRIKVYPASGKFELMASSRPIFGTGWERSDGKKQEHKKAAGTDDDRSMRRARARIREIAMANIFDYFVTLTVSADRCDRYDLSCILPKLRSFLSNRVQRFGLKYIVIPEFHKDGAIHFHGLMTGNGLKLTDSGTLIGVPGYNRPVRAAGEVRERYLQAGARVVYNIADWGLGFSTAMPLYGDYSKAVSYVCKYIGKGAQKIGGRWYWSGGPLEQPEVQPVDIMACDLAKNEDAFVMDIARAGMTLAILRGDLDDLVGGFHGD